MLPFISVQDGGVRPDGGPPRELHWDAASEHVLVPSGGEPPARHPGDAGLAALGQAFAALASLPGFGLARPRAPG